jgi:hypothetical protein
MPSDPVLEPDFDNWVGAIQFSNVIDYMGYQLTAQIGFRLGRKSGLDVLTGRDRTRQERSAFMTVFAGISE